MFESLKNLIYWLITASGILRYLQPILGRFFFKLVLSPTHNYTAVDEGGATLRMLKYKGFLFPGFNLKTRAGIPNLRIRKDDVFLCGYPKTGCHWVYEILNMLVKGNVNMTASGKFEGFIEALPAIFIDSLPSPRVLNTHVRYSQLPEQTKARKTKIILTVRSPKDTVVSFYNHIKFLRHFFKYDGKFENFFKLFMTGQTPTGSYFDFYLDWEKAMSSQNDNLIHVVEYEKLKANTLETIKEIARFLELDLTDDFIRNVMAATDFSNMKAKRPENKLLRKGQVGDWHNWLTEAQSSQIDQVCEDRMSKCFYQPKLY